MSNNWAVAEEVWGDFSAVEAVWARRVAATLATLRPREHILWSLRAPIMDLAAGPVPFVLAWTFDDDETVIEVTGNPVLPGPMRLTGVQERRLLALGFESPAPSTWFPGRDGYWRARGGVADIGWLGILVVAVITAVMDLPHPSLAPVASTSRIGIYGEAPCLHALHCMCSTDA